MRVFNFDVSIRKGLGPDWVDRVIPVALDDLPNHLTENEIQAMARAEVERYLYFNHDYSEYGKNWIIKDVHES